MSEQAKNPTTEAAKEVALERVIVSAVQIPGVKVNRRCFLEDVLKKENLSVSIDEIIESDPIQAGVTQAQLLKIANKLIITRTSQSSIASFLTGIPGGFAMAATIPADILQFFGMSLRLAQELAYLYGAKDLWENGSIDDERVKNQLILYCGVMFGVSGAVSGVRVLTSQIAKVTLKKLPQKALTKTFWYPIIKQICKAIGIKITKSTVAKGVSKAIPVVGGLVSGGLNFASMMPMAKRLMTTLDESCFDYTEEELQADIENIENAEEAADDVGAEETDAAVSSEPETVRDKLSHGVQSVKAGFGGLLGRKNAQQTESAAQSTEQLADEIIATIKKLSKLKEVGAITPEEFDTKKAELLAKL